MNQIVVTRRDKMIQIEILRNFPHSPPDGYQYEIDSVTKNVYAIWIRNLRIFSYRNDTVRSIWGFFDNKTKTYFAPINSKTMGKSIDIAYTTPYSAMQIAKRHSFIDRLYSC